MTTHNDASFSSGWRRGRNDEDPNTGAVIIALASILRR